MKQMKLVGILFLLLLAVGLFSGCNMDDGKVNNTSSPNPSATATDDHDIDDIIPGLTSTPDVSPSPSVSPNATEIAQNAARQVIEEIA